MKSSRIPWRRRLVYAMAIALSMVLTGSAAVTAVASPQRQAGFNLDTGNALLEVIYPAFQKPALQESHNGSDAPLVADHILTVELAWFDAIAPYHPTAVGIFSDLGRRPSGERTTRNRNIALIYAAYTTLSATFPDHRSRFRAMVASAGLDPDEKTEDTSTPAGLGRVAALKALKARKNDGSNRDGHRNGRYNRQPYADYTGYKPVNTAYELRNPSRWQPNMSTEFGIHKIQQFVTPHYGRVKPISYDSPKRFSLSPPYKSDHRNRRAYRRQAQEVLRASANLTDRDKMIAEFFNNKIIALGYTTGTAAIEAGGYDVEKTVHFVTTVDLAIFDVSITTYHFKRKYDAVRPFSAIRYLYGDRKIRAWGGPGKGTVDDITGNEWRSYLPTADHPEYPSASASFCMAYTQAARRFTGSDEIEISSVRPKGSSMIEPGITPSTDITLSWDSWTEVAADCRRSRVLGGVHFRDSNENVRQYAPKIGDLAYRFVQRKLAGR